MAWTRTALLMALLPSSLLWAQTAQNSYQSMRIGEVFESSGHLLVKLSAPLADPSVPQERIMALQGEGLMANWLCKFKPEPGRRLEVALRGVHIAYSDSVGDRRVIVLKARNQKPECRVVLAPVPSAENTAPARPEIDQNLEPSPPVAGSIVPATANSGVTIRQYKIED